MDEQGKQEVEVEVRRLFASDVAMHRDFLERQFSQVKWSVGILVAILAGVFLYMTGKTSADVLAYARAQVDEHVIGYRITEQLRVGLNERALQAVEDQQPLINQIVSNTINAMIATEGSKMLNDAIEEKTREIKALNLENTLLPSGTVIAWFPPKDGAIPVGWTVCDGTNGTPDLRERFIMGAPNLRDAGIKLGDARHSHSLDITASRPRSEEGAKADGYHVDDDRSRSPQASGLDHLHRIRGSTEDASNIPPSVELVFLMKV